MLLELFILLEVSIFNTRVWHICGPGYGNMIFQGPFKYMEIFLNIPIWDTCIQHWHPSPNNLGENCLAFFVHVCTIWGDTRESFAFFCKLSYLAVSTSRFRFYLVLYHLPASCFRVVIMLTEIKWNVFIFGSFYVSILKNIIRAL